MITFERYLAEIATSTADVAVVPTRLFGNDVKKRKFPEKVVLMKGDDSDLKVLKTK